MRKPSINVRTKGAVPRTAGRAAVLTWSPMFLTGEIVIKNVRKNEETTFVMRRKV